MFIPPTLADPPDLWDRVMLWLSRLTWLWVLGVAWLALWMTILGENAFAPGGELEPFQETISFFAFLGTPLSFGWMCVLAAHGKFPLVIPAIVTFLVSLWLGMAYMNAIGGGIPQHR